MYGYGYRYNSGLVIGAGGGAPFANTKSLSFDGVDDYLDCGNVWNLSTYTWSPFTLSFWYKGTNPIVGAVHLVSLLKFAPSQFLGLYDGYTGAANVKLYLNFGGLNIAWTVGSNGTVDLFDDQWHNVAIVFPVGSNDGVDATNAQMYIDNTLMAKVGSGIISAPGVSQTWNTFQIMEGEWNPLGGLVDEVALWKTDETSSVENIYNLGTPNDLTSLNPISWWRMGDGDTYPTITDNGSGGNDGTMTNMDAGDIVSDVPL